jgi:hypothetical protein
LVTDAGLVKQISLTMHDVGWIFRGGFCPSTVLFALVAYQSGKLLAEALGATRQS